MGKKELRARLKLVRSQIELSDQPEKIRNLFLQNVPLSENAVIATYIPHQSEVNVDKLNRALGYAGYKLCLPCVGNDGLIFRHWGIDTELAKNEYGIFEPSPNTKQVTPNIIIVPVLGFNAAKFRVGYGGGYYDRTFAKLAAFKVGVAYAEQEVPENFQEAHDIALDMVITDKKIY